MVNPGAAIKVHRQMKSVEEEPILEIGDGHAYHVNMSKSRGRFTCDPPEFGGIA